MFAAHCNQLYVDASVESEAYVETPLANFEPFTGDEVAWVLSHRFSGSVSSGLSVLPAQVIKHLAGESLSVVADIMNAFANHLQPPKAWKQLKLCPLYKNKGSRLDSNNYRALCVMHPVAKLYMSLINRRLELISDEKGLRAPTQAGFCSEHCLEDLALIVQTVVQHARVTGNSLGLCFVDLEKAYDSINRDKLW